MVSDSLRGFPGLTHFLEMSLSLCMSFLRCLTGDWVRIEQRFTPELSDIHVYEQLYALYSGLYPALRNTYQELAAMR
jgi:hypothetical protein